MKQEEIAGIVFWVPAGRRDVIFTGRVGGCSSGPFASLNVGEHTEDSPENVLENRRRISQAWGVSSRWLTVKQVHGPRAVRAPAAAPDGWDEEADAIVSNAGGPPLAVATADCLPIALSGPSVRAVVHAGWRGLSAGVIDEAFALTRGEASKLDVFIGPSIGLCHFEVGPEVAQAFRTRYPQAPDFETRVGGARHFDLRAAARWVVRQWGVQIDDDDPPCTFCDGAFFSHRRDGVSGRQAAIVW